MSLTAVALVLVLLYLCYCYLTGKPHPNFPPGPLRWPIWGGYLQLLLENYKFPYKAMHYMARRYNTEVLGLYMGPFPTVVACSQRSVKELLNKPEFQGRVRGFIPQQRDDDGVIRGQFFIDGHPWTEQRRFMLRTLRDFGWGTRSKKLESILEEETRDFLHLLQSNVDGVCHDGKVLVPVVFYAFFVNMSLQMLLGTRLPPLHHHKLREFALTCLRFQLKADPTTGAINMTPWVRHVAPELSGYNTLMEVNDYIKKFIKELVEEHKETFIEDAMRDYCDVYLRELRHIQERDGDQEHWFSEEQMVMTIWDVMFPGVMTVGATMGFAVEFLLHTPEVQTRVQREIDEVVGRGRLPTLDDRKNMPYTEATLRELMRREALVALALPHRCTEDTTWYGHFIPKDTMMMANLWSGQMDDRAWTDPFAFNPDRFLDDQGKLIKKDLSLPFGQGKRVCSAETFARQNLFLIFSAMMQNFSLKLPEGQPLPDVEDHLPGINISPKHFWVIMEPR